MLNVYKKKLKHRQNFLKNMFVEAVKTANLVKKWPQSIEPFFIFKNAMFELCFLRRVN